MLEDCSFTVYAEIQTFRPRYKVKSFQASLKTSEKAYVYMWCKLCICKKRNGGTLISIMVIEEIWLGVFAACKFPISAMCRPKK